MGRAVARQVRVKLHGRMHWGRWVGKWWGRVAWCLSMRWKQGEVRKADVLWYFCIKGCKHVARLG